MMTGSSILFGSSRTKSCEQVRLRVLVYNILLSRYMLRVVFSAASCKCITVCAMLVPLRCINRSGYAHNEAVKCTMALIRPQRRAQ